MATNRDLLQAKKQSEKSRFLERVPVAFRKAYQKAAAKIFNTSTYEPHQGLQECARRRRQIAAGILKKENGLQGKE